MISVNKATYQYFSLLLTSLTLSSSAMNNSSTSTMRSQASWGSFLTRIITPSSGSVFSRKQVVVGAGTVGLGVTGFFFWKYFISPTIKPATEQKELIQSKENINIKPREVIKPTFNLVVDLAAYYKIMSRISNNGKRKMLAGKFQKTIENNIPQDSNDKNHVMDVKRLLYNTDQVEAIKDFVQTSKGNNEIIEKSISIPEAPNIGDNFVELGIKASNGQITMLYKDSLTKRGDKRFAQNGQKNPYNENALSLLNGVLKELDQPGHHQVNKVS